MKINFRKISAAVLAAVMLSVSSATSVLAWGPARQTYTMAAPADHAVFNSITDNALIGDERDFVRIVEKGVGDDYTSEIVLDAGKQYDVYIYYHNDASETFNDIAHNQVGVAKEVRMISDFPDQLAKNQRGAVIGKITSTTTSPEAVWDEAYVTARESMTLHYVEGSAKIYNHWNQSGTLISTRLFSSVGTYLGTINLDGIVFGCDKFSGSVRYTIQTVATSTPLPDPDPEPTPDPDPDEPTPDPIPDPDPEEPVVPVIPEELPHTGPIEVFFAILVVALVIAGIVYWNKSRKAVKRATRNAKGKK